MSKVYIVPWTIQRFAGEICWGSCGKGLIGAITIPLDAGEIECIPCIEDDCPHAERTMDEPMGEVRDGDTAYLRKLKEPTND